MLEQVAGKTLTFIKVPKHVELNAIGRVLLLGQDPRKPINPCMHSSRRKFPNIELDDDEDFLSAGKPDAVGPGTYDRQSESNAGSVDDEENLSGPPSPV